MSNYGPMANLNQNGSFNLYEVGVSDPNQLRPREFKYHKSNVPLDFSQTTYDKLAMLTSQSSGFEGVVKKKGSNNDYTGYVQKRETNSRALSMTPSQRKSFALAAANNLANPGARGSGLGMQQSVDAQLMKTYDGRKKRQRFNEDVGETIAQNAQSQQTGKKLNANQLGKLGVSRRASIDDVESRQSKKSQYKSVTSAHQGKRAQVLDMKSETSSAYRHKIKGLVRQDYRYLMKLISQMDDKQLEKLGQELGAQVIEENDDEHRLEELDQVNDLSPTKDQVNNPEDYRSDISRQQYLEFRDFNYDYRLQEDQASVMDGKSVRSYKSSNYSAITKLAKQLEDEKQEREKMKKEIEELKKINNDLYRSLAKPESKAASPTKKGKQ
ncbi:UNKNOWN [Stylonychia lemnae]|uniref:Uncharacterized protein n=1 Tax=Stylonychia lemnae TaxID=5949 RepID=A0A078AWK9_STYLE|nr:UNKNOWN [Stylonychia lemnae]|eukprot:CDW85637.1 UNKNOWN [Stylonychia lemnae]